MICWNCGKEVPKGAKSCKFCESKIDDLPAMSPDELGQLLAASGMDEDTMEGMRRLVDEVGSAEEFANAIFVGDCPKCGSRNVGNCEETRGIENVTVGRCFDCGLFWCTECGYELKKDDTNCPHWTVCEACGEEEACPFMADMTECPKVGEWMESVGLLRGEETDEDEGEQEPDRETD